MNQSSGRKYGAAFSCKSQGFSLLELLVVLALMAMIVTGVAISFRGPVLNAQLSTAISSLQSVDQRIRYIASQKKERQLIILNLKTGKLELSGGTSDSVDLPASVRIEKVFVSHSSGDSQKLSLPYFPDGSSATWAARISNGISSSWVLFAGRSGQVRISAKEDEIETIFKLLSKRPDAN